MRQGYRLALLLLVLLVLTWATSPGMAGGSQEVTRPSRQAAPDRRTPLRPTISEAPEYESSAASVEITDVKLAPAPLGPVVRVTLRNLVDEAVLGIDFVIHGSDPISLTGHSEIALLQAPYLQVVIAPLGEHVARIPASSFKAGDKLHLAAVLFASGRGEGDANLVEEMRHESACRQLPVP